MSHLSTFLADLLPVPSEFLSVGRQVGQEITLSIGPGYTTGFLIAGPLLVLAGIVLIVVMYGRVKYFAMEYGYGTGWGRIKAIFHYIVMGLLLAVTGLVLTLIGWGNQGYSVILSAAGLTEVSHLGTTTYRWDDLKATSERVKSTDFWLRFERDGKRCQVRFLQQDLGEEMQDAAITITEQAVRSHPSTGISL
jgi:hypothetical protein